MVERPSSSGSGDRARPSSGGEQRPVGRAFQGEPLWSVAREFLSMSRSTVAVLLTFLAVALIYLWVRDVPGDGGAPAPPVVPQISSPVVSPPVPESPTDDPATGTPTSGTPTLGTTTPGTTISGVPTPTGPSTARGTDGVRGASPDAGERPGGTTPRETGGPRPSGSVSAPPSPGAPTGVSTPVR